MNHRLICYLVWGRDGIQLNAGSSCRLRELVEVPELSQLVRSERHHLFEVEKDGHFREEMLILHRMHRGQLDCMYLHRYKPRWVSEYMGAVGFSRSTSFLFQAGNRAAPLQWSRHEIPFLQPTRSQLEAIIEDGSQPYHIGPVNYLVRRFDGNVVNISKTPSSKPLVLGERKNNLAI